MVIFFRHRLPITKAWKWLKKQFRITCVNYSKGKKVNTLSEEGPWVGVGVGVCPFAACRPVRI